VIHWRATRLLAQLPDDTLPPEAELEVRLHVARCARCRSKLHRIQLSEDLLRRIPPAIVPIDTGPGAYVRLASLSRWADDGEIKDPEGWRVSALGVASAFLLLCLVASAGAWAPTVTEHAPPTIVLLSPPPDSAHIPGNYR
jgi:anti-sigma factor RsiW